MVLPTIQFLTVPSPYLTYKMDQPSNVAASKVSKILLPQSSLNSRMKQKKLSSKKKSRSLSKNKLQIELLKQHIENIKIERIKLSLENEELRLSLNKPSDFKSQSSHNYDLDTLYQMLGLSEKSTQIDNKNPTALSNDSCSPTPEFKDRPNSDEDSGISSESDNQSDIDLQEDIWMEDFFSVLRHKNESEASLKRAGFVSSPQLKDWALLYLVLMAVMVVKNSFSCKIVTAQCLQTHILFLTFLYLRNPTPLTQIPTSLLPQLCHKT